MTSHPGIDFEQCTPRSRFDCSIEESKCRPPNHAIDPEQRISRWVTRFFCTTLRKLLHPWDREELLKNLNFSRIIYLFLLRTFTLINFNEPEQRFFFLLGPGILEGNLSSTWFGAKDCAYRNCIARPARSAKGERRSQDRLRNRNEFIVVGGCEWEMPFCPF